MWYAIYVQQASVHVVLYCSITFLLDIVFGNLTPVLDNLLNRQKWYVVLVTEQSELVYV